MASKSFTTQEVEAIKTQAYHAGRADKGLEMLEQWKQEAEARQGATEKALARLPCKLHLRWLVGLTILVCSLASAASWAIWRIMERFTEL
jgi:hypothetical protein